MIEIIDIGKPDGEERDDVSEYSLRKDNVEIVIFLHNKKDGLYSLLSRASFALLETDNHELYTNCEVI